MNSLLSLLVLTFLILCGCSHVKNINPEQSNDITLLKKGIENKNISVLLNSGETKQAQKVHLSTDSISWPLPDKTTIKIATTDVSSIIRIRHGHGAFEGAGIGLLSGALVGAMIGFIAGDDEEGLFRMSAADKAGLGAVVLGGVGVITGSVVGAIAGSQQVYEIQPETKSNKLP